MIILTLLFIMFGIGVAIKGSQFSNYLFFIGLLATTLTVNNSYLIQPNFYAFPIFNSLTFYLSTGLGILISIPLMQCIDQTPNNKFIASLQTLGEVFIYGFGLFVSFKYLLISVQTFLQHTFDLNVQSLIYHLLQSILGNTFSSLIALTICSWLVYSILSLIRFRMALFLLKLLLLISVFAIILGYFAYINNNADFSDFSVSTELSTQALPYTDDLIYDLAGLLSLPLGLKILLTLNHYNPELTKLCKADLNNLLIKKTRKNSTVKNESDNYEQRNKSHHKVNVIFIASLLIISVLFYSLLDLLANSTEFNHFINGIPYSILMVGINIFSFILFKNAVNVFVINCGKTNIEQILKPHSGFPFTIIMMFGVVSYVLGDDSIIFNKYTLLVIINIVFILIPILTTKCHFFFKALALILTALPILLFLASQFFVIRLYDF